MPGVLWDVIEPGLRTFGYKAPDPTYGRYLIPTWEPERVLDADPTLVVTQRRIFLADSAPPESVDIVYSEDVKITGDELSKERKKTGRWVYYKCWEKSEAWKAEQKQNGGANGLYGDGVDLVYIHGLNEYGTRFASHAPTFLAHGFRVILPDLPSYGRSTGVHSNLTDPHLLTSAVHAVLQDVVNQDLAAGKSKREVFMAGSSMGGWTTLYYLITYPPTLSPEKIAPAVAAEEHRATANDHSQSGKASVPDPQKEPRPKVAGAFVLCPLVEVAPASRPNMVVEGIARAIVKVAPSLPMAEAVRGNVSDDPRVEEEFLQDPLTYHGKLRASTGLSLLHGFIELGKKAEMINLPIRIVHGDQDRATSHLATVKFYERMPAKEKELEIYKGYEHVMMKVGIDEADDAKRQAVLKDWLGWLEKRISIDRKSGRA